MRACACTCVRHMCVHTCIQALLLNLSIFGAYHVLKNTNELMLALSIDLFCEQLLIHGLFIHTNASLPVFVRGTYLCFSCFFSFEVPCSPFAQPLQSDFCVISKHTLQLCTCGIIHNSQSVEATYCQLRDEWIKKCG